MSELSSYTHVRFQSQQDTTTTVGDDEFEAVQRNSAILKSVSNPPRKFIYLLCEELLGWEVNMSNSWNIDILVCMIPNFLPNYWVLMCQKLQMQFLLVKCMELFWFCYIFIWYISLQFRRAPPPKNRNRARRSGPRKSGVKILSLCAQQKYDL